MTNQQGAPEALRLADEFRLCNEYDSIPSINDIAKAEVELRRLHAENERLAALVEAQQQATHVQNPAEIAHVAGDVSKNGAESNMAQQPAPSAAAAVSDEDEALDLLATLFDAWESGTPCYEEPESSDGFLGHALRLDDEVFHRCADLLNRRRGKQPAPTAQADSQPCPTCAALARTVMLDQVSFDRKPDCYGIRQITDDEGIEEWEDIRTSPDVAREEANDMMATGRGEIYEVVPLWTTPQPSPTPQADSQPARDDLPREDFAWLVVQEACETEPADEDDPECIRILRRDLKSAVLAAFLRQDAASAPADSVTAPAGSALAGPTPIAGVERTFGYWQTHFIHEPFGDHSAIPLTPADKADGWTEVALVAAQPAKAADSVLEDAARWQELREQHEDDTAERCCVFAPNDMRECLVPVGSLPGELDAFMDSERAARKQGGAT